MENLRKWSYLWGILLKMIRVVTLWLFLTHTAVLSPQTRMDRLVNHWYLCVRQIALISVHSLANKTTQELFKSVLILVLALGTWYQTSNEVLYSGLFCLYIVDFFQLRFLLHFTQEWRFIQNGGFFPPKGFSDEYLSSSLIG